MKNHKVIDGHLLQNNKKYSPSEAEAKEPDCGMDVSGNEGVL